MSAQTSSESLLMQDPSRFLRELLIERKLRNTRYSARAMARDLGLSQAFLSLILAGKRSLSVEQRVRLAARLGLQLNLGLSSTRRKTNQTARTVSLLKHTMEHELILKHWYHFALLELTQTGQFFKDGRAAARRLGISEVEARDAIQRLIDYGYLEEDLQSVLRRTRTAFIIDSKKSSRALRTFHQSRLKASFEELEEASPERVQNRSFQTIFVPTSRTRARRAKVLMQEFQKKIVEYLMEGTAEEVFQVSLQVYSIDRKSKE